MTNLSVYKNEAKKEYKLTDEKRAEYRRLSHESRLAKIAADEGLHIALHSVNNPKLNPDVFMPQLKSNGLTSLSLFSGGGGLDLGFDKAGYKHIASYELIPVCKETLLKNRPNWLVFGGKDDGDVTKVNWQKYMGEIDVIHGGPPCQPFSIAGEQKGKDDDRNMWGEFTRAVNTVKPRVFVAENVLGLLNPKFNDFIKTYILEPLKEYHIVKFEMNAADFGIPQIRKRVFFVGFRDKEALKKFIIPRATHVHSHFGNSKNKKTVSIHEKHQSKTMGVREALGLDDIGFDNLAPTIRSGFTGKRNTTSVLNSSAGQKAWGDIQIWASGVQSDRKRASNFPAKNGHFRLAVQDIALIQGFPELWEFSGAVYQVLGQIGNSVSPPVAYQVAKNVVNALAV